jgi:hypothetical protein
MWPSDSTMKNLVAFWHLSSADGVFECIAALRISLDCIQSEMIHISYVTRVDEGVISNTSNDEWSGSDDYDGVMVDVEEMRGRWDGGWSLGYGWWMIDDRCLPWCASSFG